MEGNFLTQEEFESLFQQYHSPQTTWAMPTPYKVRLQNHDHILLASRGLSPGQSLRNFLTLPSSLDWRRDLVSLSILHFVIITYVNYRQYKVLQRAERPKTLQNVITHETNNAVTAHQGAEIKFYCWSGVYELIVTLLLVYCEILPKVWVIVTKFLWTDLGRSIEIAYNREFGYTLYCPLFYVVCALLWTTIHLPVTYVESCIIGESHTSTKLTPTKWITKVAKDQMWSFFKVFFLIITQEQSRLDFSFDSTYSAAFNTMCLAGVFYLVYELAILPFMPAKWLQLYPLRAGKTRTALETLVRDSGLALGDVYTLPNSKRNANDIDVVIFGPFWRRSIAIYEDVLEKCNTQDIVALTAGELRSWKQNPIVRNGVMFVVSPTHRTSRKRIHTNLRPIVLCNKRNLYLDSTLQLEGDMHLVRFQCNRIF